MIEENFQHYLPPGVLVLPVSRGVYERLAESLDRVFVHPNAIQADHLDWMTGVALNEGDRTIDYQRHGAANILVIAGATIGLRSAICISQNATLWEHCGRILRQQDDAGRGGVVFA